MVGGVQCANLDKKTYIPLLPEALTYDIFLVSGTQYIWSFGLILYKNPTGRDIFHNAYNVNLELNNDFSNIDNSSSDYSL